MKAVLSLFRPGAKPYSLSILICIGLLIVMVFINPSFFEYYGLSSKFGSILPLVFVALGQTMVIMAGGIDLSVSSMIAMTNVIMVTMVMRLGENWWTAPVAIAVALLVGAAAGLVNGLLVAVLRLPALIATFATQVVWTGVALTVMSESGGEVPFEWYDFYSSAIPLWPGSEGVGIPMTVVILLAAFGVLWLLGRTGLVVHLKAVGGNPAGAFESTLPVTWLIIKAYIWCGLFASAATVFIVAQTISGNPLSGQGYDLQSISAVVLGGTSMAGGYGAFFGSVVGVCILKLVDDLIFFFKLTPNFQLLTQGLIIIAALAAGDFLAMMKKRRREDSK